MGDFVNENESFANGNKISKCVTTNKDESNPKPKTQFVGAVLSVLVLNSPKKKKRFGEEEPLI